MTTTLGELAVLLTANNAKFNRKIEDSKSALGQLEAAAQTAAKAAGVVFVVGAVVSGKLIDAASDAAEQMNVLDIAFGDNAQSVVDWSEETSKAIGRSRADLKSWAGQIGALLAPTMGVTDATTDMSTNLAQLAVDLASVNNETDVMAVDALKSALIGSSEPLRAFGIVMSVASLNAFALSKGIATTVEKMSAAEQQTLRYAFIMDRASVFQGDAAKTAAGWANMTKRVAGQITDLTASVGEGLLPYAEQLIAVVSNIIAVFQELSPETLAYIGLAIGLGTAIAGAVAAAAGLGLALPVMAAGLATAAGAALGLIVPLVAIAAAIAGSIVAVALMRKAWVDNLGGIRTNIKDAANWIGKTWSKLSSFVSNTWSDATSFISESIGSLSNDMIDSINVITPGAGDALKVLERLAGGSDEVKETWEELKDTGKRAFDTAGSSIGEYVDFAADALKELAGEFGITEESVDGLIGKLKELTKVQTGVSGTVGVDLPGFGGGDGGGNGPKDPADGDGPKGLADGVGAAVGDGPSTAAAVSGVGQGALGKLGTAGGVLQSGMQGFAAGGPFGAIIAVIADLLMRTEGFIETIESLNGIFDGLIDAIGPLTEVGVGLTDSIGKGLAPIFTQLKTLFEFLSEEAIGPLFKALAKLNDAVMPIVEIIFIVLTPIIKLFGMALGLWVKALDGIVTAIAYVVNFVIDVVGEILSVVVDVLGDLPFVGDEIKKFAASIRGARIDIDNLGESTAEAAEATAMSSEAAMLWGQAMMALALGNMEEHSRLLWEWRKVQDGLSTLKFTLGAGPEDDPTDPLKDLGDAATETAESFREVSASLANIPEGFKVAAARFGATVGDSDLGETSVGGNTIIIQANDARDIWEKLKGFDREDMVLGGLSPATATPNAVDRMGS